MDCRDCGRFRACDCTYRCLVCDQVRVGSPVHDEPDGGCPYGDGLDPE